MAVAALIEPCTCLFDIGSDHAFLPIELFKRGLLKRAVASDIGEGPIRSAKRNIRRAGLSDQIATTVTNGLLGHEVCAEDTVVIAGLGGFEMIDILSAYGPVRAPMILQPQKSAYELRVWLNQKQYQIIFETLAEDRGRIYPILKVQYAPEPLQPLSKVEAYLGPILLRDKPALYLDYLDQRKRHLTKAVLGQPELSDVLMLVKEGFET